MNFALLRSRSTLITGSALMLALTASAYGQKEIHGRKYKPLQPAADITITVEKATNGKPLTNAAVIFRATRDGKEQGGLEVKTNPDGEGNEDTLTKGRHS